VTQFFTEIIQQTLNWIQPQIAIFSQNERHRKCIQ